MPCDLIRVLLRTDKRRIIELELEFQNSNRIRSITGERKEDDYFSKCVAKVLKKKGRVASNGGGEGGEEKEQAKRK